MTIERDELTIGEQITAAETVEELRELLSDVTGTGDEKLFTVWAAKLESIRNPADTPRAAYWDEPTSRLVLEYIEREPVVFTENGSLTTAILGEHDAIVTICPRMEYGTTKGQGFVPLAGNKNDANWKLGTIILQATIHLGPLSGHQTWVGTVGSRKATSPSGRTTFDVSQQFRSNQQQVMANLAREAVSYLWGGYEFKTEDARNEILAKGSPESIKKFFINGRKTEVTSPASSMWMNENGDVVEQKFEVNEHTAANIESALSALRG